MRALAVALAAFLLVIALLLVVAYLLDLWLPMLACISLWAIIAELIWRNWWGDRYARERMAGRDAGSR